MRNSRFGSAVDIWIEVEESQIFLRVIDEKCTVGYFRKEYIMRVRQIRTLVGPGVPEWD